MSKTIEDLTIGELRDLLKLLPAGSQNKTHSLKLGQSVLIRTITQFYTGRIKAITDCDLVLEDAAWIASTGRFSSCLKTGNLDEIEPFVSDVIVQREVVVDITEWKFPLPREQK